MKQEEIEMLDGLKKINLKKEQIKEDLIFMEDIQKKYLNRRNKNIIKYGLILSSAALIILFFSLFTQSIGNIDYQDLYHKYYFPLKQDLQIRTKTNKVSIFEQVRESYNINDFKSSRLLLDSLLSEDPTNEEFLLFQALINLGENLFIEAKEELTNLMLKGGSIGVHARWYLTLIAINEENPDIAKEHIHELKRIKDNNYKEEIRNLGRKIRFRKTK